MRLVVDANPMFPLGPGLGPTGVGRWATEALRSLAEHAPDWQIDLVAFRVAKADLDASYFGPNVTFTGRRFSNRLYRKLRGLNALPPAEWVLGDFDAMLGPAFITWRTSKAAQVPVIHDLAYIRYPESVSRKNLVFLKLNVPRIVKRSEIIATVSETTKEELVATFGLESDRVHVVPNGVDTKRFSPEASGNSSRLELPDDYLLFVGTLEPRKNLPFALAVHEALTRENPATPPLIVVGGTGWREGPLRAKLETAIVGGRVIAPGYVEDDELPRLYARAVALLFPSRYEGFGLPVIEAMSSGCPVIASNGGALPEVVGDAAPTLPPDDLELWVETVNTVIADKDTRESLRSKGLSRATRFPWSETGDALRTAVARAVELRRSAAR